jgi:sialic acid synthase SpsE
MRDMLEITRPGTGIPPKYMEWFIGKRAKENIKKDELMTWEVI